MEGNDCYKFSTISNYLLQTGSKPIKVAVDCGANVGNVTSLIRRYFPGSRIYAFEPVQPYFEATRDRFSGDPRVKVFNRAVTYLHLYSDDLGDERRPAEDPLAVFLARTDTCGPNAIGGSVIGSVNENRDPSMYTRLADRVSKITFDELTQYVLNDAGESEVDYVKFDCEGCEWSCLGCVSPETLSKIRFIFRRIPQHRTFQQGDGEDADAYASSEPYRKTPPRRVFLRATRYVPRNST